MAFKVHEFMKATNNSGGYDWSYRTNDCFSCVMNPDYFGSDFIDKRLTDGKVIKVSNIDSDESIFIMLVKKVALMRHRRSVDLQFIRIEHPIG